MTELFTIDDSTEEFLKKKPESGMGFQIIGDRKNCWVVFNMTIACKYEELKNTVFTKQQYNFLTRTKQPKNLDKLKNAEIDDNPQLVFSQLMPNINNTIINEYIGLNRPQEVIELPSTRRLQMFFRYSTFTIDKRIDQKTGNFLAGTYATTYNDIRHVPSGYAAVGRYALPCPAPATCVFQIVTNTSPKYAGAVAPNFGQAGGGVEVYFENGAKHRTGRPFTIAFA